jgi:hypothetical protein
MSERNLGALHQPKEETLWYYRSLADGFCERLPIVYFPMHCGLKVKAKTNVAE